MYPYTLHFQHGVWQWWTTWFYPPTPLPWSPSISKHLPTLLEAVRNTGYVCTRRPHIFWFFGWAELYVPCYRFPLLKYADCVMNHFWHQSSPPRSDFVGQLRHQSSTYNSVDIMSQRLTPVQGHLYVYMVKWERKFNCLTFFATIKSVVKVVVFNYYRAIMNPRDFRHSV